MKATTPIAEKFAKRQISAGLGEKFPTEEIFTLMPHRSTSGAPLTQGSRGKAGGVFGGAAYAETAREYRTEENDIIKAEIKEDGEENVAKQKNTEIDRRYNRQTEADKIRDRSSEYSQKSSNFRDKSARNVSGNKRRGKESRKTKNGEIG